MTKAVDSVDFAKPIVHGRSVSAAKCGLLEATADFGDAGTVTVDEPTALGGSDPGSSPLHGVAAAPWACNSATPGHVAEEWNSAPNAPILAPRSRLTCAVDPESVESFPASVT